MPPALRPSIALVVASGLLAACSQMPPSEEKLPKAPESAAKPAAGATPTRTAAAPPATAASGPAGTGTRPGAAASAPPGSSLTTSGAPPNPAGPPPFAVVIREARRIDGPLTFWQKDDKVWLELMPSQLGKPFLMSPKIRNGIGEAFVLGGLMAYPINGAGGQQIVEFVRVHNQVRLQARNTDITVAAGTPEARAVASSYSNSLLAATPVASQPHPDRKSVLVDATSIFLNDMLGVGMMLQRGLRQGYGLDRGNSLITAVRGSEQSTEIEVQQHFFTGAIAVPGFVLPGLPQPGQPRFLPDSRSMLIGLQYSLAPLPEQPMPTRRADPRVGLFTTTVLDFTSDLPASPRQRFINRWRLEKKDPAAEKSEPVKPITFWIDRNVPLAYRETVRAAILEWNQAFEKIGFINAIKVEQQPDDAKFDTLDFGYASVRWMLNAEPSFGAIGPSHFDPRTGEILDADIAFEGMSTRSIRSLRTQVLRSQATVAVNASEAPLSFADPFVMPQTGEMPPELVRCMQAALAAEQLGYALDVLEAQGDMDPDGPVARQFVQDYVKESIMHEVGHALGLRHNFRASRAYTEAQLADPEFTRAHGISGSVMEYNAVNLPLPGKTGGMPFHTALGPYDYWAIEYAYKPLPAGIKPEEERAELQKIAARSNDPLLAFGTDEDSFFGLDPETIQMDLGADPLAFAGKRLEIARDLFKRQETRELPPDRDYAVLRRSIGYAINDATRAVGVLARQIGGVRTLRDFPGSGREPMVPVPADIQRKALDLISRAVLSPEGLSLSPALQRRLAPDFLDRAEGAVATEFSVQQRLLDLQRAVLNYLMSDVIAMRVLDGAAKVDKPAEAFQLGELLQRLSTDLWPELSGKADSTAPISSARRDLQRDHVNRLSLAVVRPTFTGRADVRGHMREQARALLTRLDAALRAKHGAFDAETRAHLADCADTLRQALLATIQRQAL
jgi:hypothetical protein